jgi:hypothetical protein
MTPVSEWVTFSTVSVSLVRGSPRQQEGQRVRDEGDARGQEARGFTVDLDGYGLAALAARQWSTCAGGRRCRAEGGGRRDADEVGQVAEGVDAGERDRFKAVVEQRDIPAISRSPP